MLCGIDNLWVTRPKHQTYLAVKENNGETFTPSSSSVSSSSVSPENTPLLVLFVLLVLLIFVALGSGAAVLTPLLLPLPRQHLTEHAVLLRRAAGDVRQEAVLVHVEDVLHLGVDDERLALLVRRLVEAAALQETVAAPHLVQREAEVARLHHPRLFDPHPEAEFLQCSGNEL
ncbi:hypothetical protein EYF80_065432 [Liparis tanakae]|uniref:Uncharacterized protein n=1 Tax=Liparis tanakae TaxID=230148 RepID=A0A4Z2E7A3_9TELE|nr:hypothetical protein EYF80_065432 [Liparis tanakae]